MPVEFEDIVFGLNAGEISRPFLTPQGIHIVKVLEQQEILPFERMKGQDNPLSNPSSWNG
jgi:PPIC-type PPIASE domain.